MADDDNGMTSVDAKAFKRACSCFGLGRYFYDVPAIWVDLDQNRHPAKTPCIVRWSDGVEDGIAGLEHAQQHGGLADGLNNEGDDFRLRAEHQRW